MKTCRPLLLAWIAAGDIWLGRWPPVGAGDRTIYDVLDASGRPLRTVIVPADLQADPPPFVSSEWVVGVVRDPLTGVERVGVFRVSGAPPR